MLLNMKDKPALVLHKQALQLPAPSQFWKIIENADTILSFLKETQQNYEFTQNQYTPIEITDKPCNPKS